jgi:hypothetical protein
MAFGALVAAVTGVPHAQGQLPCRYEVDVIFGPQCGATELASVHGYGITEKGDICGDFECSGGEPDAFVSWNAGALAPLTFPQGTARS